jgi:hypothetical protein
MSTFSGTHRRGDTLVPKLLSLSEQSRTERPTLTRHPPASAITNKHVIRQMLETGRQRLTPCVRIRDEEDVSGVDPSPVG